MLLTAGGGQTLIPSSSGGTGTATRGTKLSGLSIPNGAEGAQLCRRPRVPGKHKLHLEAPGRCQGGPEGHLI